MRNKPGKPTLISVVGPTAVGKTAVAIKLARKLNTEIISADSRQFYKEMHIGTAKPGFDELQEVKHHFINSHSIDQLYSSGEFGRDAAQLLEQLFQKHKVLIAVGGSGLYLKALWEGFDDMPEIDQSIREQLNRELRELGITKLQEELQQTDPIYYDQVDVNNGQRIIRALEVIRSTGNTFSSYRQKKVKDVPYENLKIGLNMERSELFKRIDERMDKMIASGLFEEAEGLIDYRDHNALQTVGYSEIFDYIDGKYDKEEAIRLLKRNSRRYAKRQLTWFRKFEDITWFEPDQENEIHTFINDRVENR